MHLVLKDPPPPCNSLALVQATAGVGPVSIWYLILLQWLHEKGPVSLGLEIFGCLLLLAVKEPKFS